MIVLRIALDAPASTLMRVKALSAVHPGEHALSIRAGQRRLTLGPAWRYADSDAALAALSTFGTVEKVDAC